MDGRIRLLPPQLPRGSDRSCWETYVPGLRVTWVTHVTHVNARQPAWHAAAGAERGGGALRVRGSSAPGNPTHKPGWELGTKPCKCPRCTVSPPGTLLGGHPGDARIQVGETAMTHLWWARPTSADPQGALLAHQAA